MVTNYSNSWLTQNVCSEIDKAAKEMGHEEVFVIEHEYLPTGQQRVKVYPNTEYLNLLFWFYINNDGSASIYYSKRK